MDEEEANGDGAKLVGPVHGRGEYGELCQAESDRVQDERRGHDDADKLEKVPVKLARPHGIDVVVGIAVVVGLENDEPGVCIGERRVEAWRYHDRMTGVGAGENACIIGRA